MTRSLTRVRQVFDFLTKRPTPADEAWALSLLPESAHGLYHGMRPYDRYHCTAIARKFSQLNPPAWALHAALLHDCGKPMTFGLICRVGSVLAKRFKLSVEPFERTSWKRALQIYQWHGHYGAQVAETAGLAEEACHLIRHHHDHTVSGVPWLADFQRIDDD